MDLLIKFNNVSFTYEDSDKKALEDINFEINTGELVLITGASGSGKSTIYKCINGLIPHIHDGKLLGEIFIDDKNTKDCKNYELCKMIGSVSQNPRGQFFTDNTTSELAFTLENLGYEVKEILEKIDNISKFFGLENILNKNVLEISGGEKQKISIACVSILDAKTLIFDEPSANLDYLGIELLKEIFSKLKENGYTIVVVEHRIFYLKELLDRLIHINNGKLIANLERKEALNYRADDLRSLNPFDEELVKKESYKQDEKVLEVKNLKFKDIIKDISFDVYRGEIIGLVGKNGVGKSTISKLISGIYKKNSGGIFSSKLPFVLMQDVDYQLFSESVFSEFLLSNKNLKEDEILDILNIVNLYEKRNSHPFSLSGGEKQRLLMGICAKSNSDVLILDEPTSGLDFNNMLVISDIIKNLSKDKAIILISHDYELLSRVVDRVIFLEEGKISQDFVLKERNQLTNIFQKIKGGKENES